jgi:hypothetical protein
MRVAIFDRLEPPMPSELPVRMAATCSHGATIAMLALAIPGVLAIGAASLILVLNLLLTPAARAIVAQHPALALEILAALAFWIYLLGWPLKRLFGRLAARRTINIEAGIVTVTESGHFHTATWSVLLDSYTGIAHHVRASISGSRHELILVHPTREKAVLLGLADRMSQTEIDRVAALLGHKEIPASALYRFIPLWPAMLPPAWRDPAHA